MDNTFTHYEGTGMTRAECETICNDIGLDCLGFMLDDANGICLTYVYFLS